MINHNALLDDTFNQNIEVKFNNTIWTNNYSEGDLFELWRFLQHKDRKYPVIWLQSGYTVKEKLNGSKISLIGCRFFFITKGDSTDYYKKRYLTTYQEILYPLKDLFIQKINNSSGIERSEDINFITFPFNSVSELSARDSSNGSKRLAETSDTPDYWDALLLNMDLTINTDCYTEYEILKK